jgi:hypothetical protein
MLKTFGSLSHFVKVNSFVVDFMDAGGRATHGAVAESLVPQALPLVVEP